MGGRPGSPAPSSLVERACTSGSEVLGASLDHMKERASFSLFFSGQFRQKQAEVCLVFRKYPEPGRRGPAGDRKDFEARVTIAFI